MRWPLHPKPGSLTLRSWVENLAGAYGVSFPSFCAQALGIAHRGSEARWFGDPSTEVLSRLSAGTGLAIDELRGMRTEARLRRALEELRRFCETEQGRRMLEAHGIEPSASSLNS